MGCTGNKVAPEPAPEPEPVAEPEPEPEPQAGEAKMCGGIAGMRCDDGFACVDDPRDSCDPAHGGADCSGLCKACDDASLARTYINQNPDECAAIKFTCDDGQAPFSDACGCGCATTPPSEPEEPKAAPE